MSVAEGEGLASLRGRLAELGGRAIKKFIGRAEKVPQPRKTVTFDADKLNKKYDAHAEAFGITGNRNKAKLAEFTDRIEEFLADPAHPVVEVDYRGQGPAIVTYDPVTKMMVMQHPNGQFWSTWKLFPSQLESILTKGTLQ